MTKVLDITTCAIIFCVIFNCVAALIVIRRKIRSRETNVSGAIKMKLREKTLAVLGFILLSEFVV